MSNLGAYQMLTTIAKKVGGPINLLVIVFFGGALTTAGVSSGVKAIKKKILSVYEEKRMKEEQAKVFTVNKEGKSNEGLLFLEGENFTVLEADGDAALVNKVGDDNSPYFVSRRFLSSISDYMFS